MKFTANRMSLGLSAATVGVLGLLISCSKAEFKSSPTRPGVRAATRPDTEPAVGAKPKTDAPPLESGGNTSNGEGLGKTTPGNNANGEKLFGGNWPNTPQNPCAPRDKPYRIVIIDLKSGWFAGDGDGFFTDILKIECTQKIEIVYAHLTREIIETNFADGNSAQALLPCLGNRTKRKFGTDKCTLGSIAGFDQAWLLSGSSRDGDDLGINKGFYSSIRDRFRELKAGNPKSSFFFSAGVGNTDHSNDMGKDLFPQLAGQSGEFSGKLFLNNPGADVGTLPNRNWGKNFAPGILSPGDSAASGTFLKAFPAFKDMTGIFDYKKEAHGGLGECLGDPVVAANVQGVIQDHCGRLGAAAAVIGEHKIYLEGNTARFYGSRSPDELKTGKVGPMDYLMRVVSALM